MAVPLPNFGALRDAFASAPSMSNQSSDSAQAPRSRYQARQELYATWSAVDDAKDKANKLSNAAVKELQQASAKAQQATGKIEMYSPKFYAACTTGGLLACGLTHTAVTPLDLLKCRLQIDKNMYKGNFDGWGKIMRAEGFRGIYTGWGPTLWGYSAQGAFKYGGYEYFKKFYSDLAGSENAKQYKTLLYLTASASAEFFADIALCPFEAVKVRMQTTIPPFAKSTFGGISTVTAKEGTAGLFKGLYPLWGRQIPYTMMKFASFETIVEMIYDRLPGQKSEYGKGAQTAVSFVAGYLAGIACAIVSHPADVMVSKLNATRKDGEAFGAATARIYKDIGFGGLWNGLVVRIFMIGTLTGLQWLIYDSYKVALGLPTTGGPAPEEKKEKDGETVAKLG
ncbi:mitochondrial carrier domain-containing protein [Phyllosticta capitalensis]